mgnify:CR=1 FL=1
MRMYEAKNKGYAAFLKKRFPPRGKMAKDFRNNSKYCH